MKNQKGLLTVVLFSLLFVWQAAAFNIGDRVQANGTVNVRQTAAGTLLGSQSSGSQGAVIGGPEIISNRDGERITPFVVLFGGDFPIVGTIAKAAAEPAP